MARPKKEVSGKLVQELAALGCKVTEIASALDVSPDTLQRRFAAELAKGKDNLRISLRRLQIQAAQKGNVVMLIWLGKQYLDQSEKVEQQVDAKVEAKAEITYVAEWGGTQEPASPSSDAN
jgi:hypothetical protein